jgi:hypothetical protein
VSDSSFPVSTATHVTLGVERWLSPTRLIHAEGFYKKYEQLLMPNSLSSAAAAADEFLVGHGNTYGADLLIRQLGEGPFSGWLAYTYLVGTRVDPSGAQFFPTQDRRHNLNLVGDWRVGEYTIGARANLASGLPYTPSIGAFVRDRYDPVTGRWNAETANEAQQYIAGATNSSRLPVYDRIDVSVTRLTRVRGATVSPYFSLLNVLNAHNPAAYLYDFAGPPTRATIPNLPFIPTFGVRVAY